MEMKESEMKQTTIQEQSKIEEGTMTTKLSDVKAAQNQWFNRGNKQFFGDIDYRVLHGKINTKPYLVRSTYMWSDMLGGQRKIYWKINPLNEDLKIQPVLDTDFRTLEDVKDWLKFQ